MADQRVIVKNPRRPILAVPSATGSRSKRRDVIGFCKRSRIK